jgi:glycosyltransferase involved in cell wall biosynthesis
VNNSPAVTVVIPTHNRRDLLLRTLNSVLAQSDVVTRVVVVDDGGEDGTTDALRELASEHVRVIRHERSKGVSAARNSGLAIVATPWVAFVDDDDLWAPEKLSAQIIAVQDDPAARWSCVGALHVDSALRVVLHAPAPASGDVSGELLQSNVVPGGGSGLLVATTLAREVGGFDESISILADWDFNLRVSLRSPVAAVRRPLLAYYVHSDSMYHNPAGVMRELLYLQNKHCALVDGRAFRFDRGSWAVDLSLMAHRLGDDATARSLIRQAGIKPVARAVVQRLLGQVRRVSGVPQREPPQLVPSDEPAPPWLNQHA